MTSENNYKWLNLWLKRMRLKDSFKYCMSIAAIVACGSDRPHTVYSSSNSSVRECDLKDAMTMSK